MKLASLDQHVWFPGAYSTPPMWYAYVLLDSLEPWISCAQKEADVPL